MVARQYSSATSRCEPSAHRPPASHSRLFSQLAQQAEKLPGGLPGMRLTRTSPGAVDELMQLIRINAREGFYQPVQQVLISSQQFVTPVRHPLELTPLRVLLCFKFLQCCPHGLAIVIAHQSTDILKLASAGAMAPGPASRKHCFFQLQRQIQGLHFGFIQFEQLLAL